MDKIISILAISGSLRQKSSNTAIMNALADLAPENVRIQIFEGIGDLPHFNPDIDTDRGPDTVEGWRKQLKEADAVLICTPEYANGVPGVLKNALDWIVSSGEFMNKPTAVISASPTPMGGDKAHASLLLTLRMMTARIVEGATLMIPQITVKLNQEGVLADSETKLKLRNLLIALEQACNPAP